MQDSEALFHPSALDPERAPRVDEREEGRGADDLLYFDQVHAHEAKARYLNRVGVEIVVVLDP